MMYQRFTIFRCFSSTSTIWSRWFLFVRCCAHTQWAWLIRFLWFSSVPLKLIKTNRRKNQNKTTTSFAILITIAAAISVKPKQIVTSFSSSLSSSSSPCTQVKSLEALVLSPAPPLNVYFFLVEIWIVLCHFYLKCIEIIYGKKLTIFLIHFVDFNTHNKKKIMDNKQIDICFWIFTTITQYYWHLFAMFNLF